MLSVTPVVPLDVQLINQSFELPLMSNVTIVKLDAGWSSQNLPGGMSAITFNAAGGDAANMYGIAGHLNGNDFIFTPTANQAIPMGRNDLGSDLWQRVKAPQLDPISSNPPGLSPIRIDAGDAEMVSQPVRAPSAIEAGDMPTSPSTPISESPATISAERSVGAVHDSAKPNWLSVTFSPEEQHRLDATTVDAHFERTMAVRDPKARFALEPTRVTCQAFCDPVAAPSSEQDDAAESPGLPVLNPAATRGATQPLEPLPEGTTSAAIEPAIRAAAILDWETSHAAVLAAPPTTMRPSQRTAGRQESSFDAGDELEESEIAASSTVAQFLDENKYLAGVLLAALATKTLWSYGGGVDAQSAGGTLKLLRKRIATNG